MTTPRRLRLLARLGVARGQAAFMSLVWLGVWPLSTLLAAAIGAIGESWPLAARTALQAAILVPVMVWCVVPAALRLSKRLGPADAAGGARGRASGGLR